MTPHLAMWTRVDVASPPDDVAAWLARAAAVSASVDDPHRRYIDRYASFPVRFEQHGHPSRSSGGCIRRRMEGQAHPHTLGETLLERFALKNPLAASLRFVFERLFARGEINALFERNRDQQHTRNILFVTVVEVMLAVVTRKVGSVHAALQKRKGSVGATFTAFYNKLNGTGTGPSEALVSHAFERGHALLKEMGGLRAEPLPG